MPTNPAEIAKSGLLLAENGKTINIKQLLPAHLEFSEVGDFVGFFEGVLNRLYYHEVSARGTNDDFEIDANGTYTFYATCATSAGDLITSADPNYATSAAPIRYEITSADTISVLEKIDRLRYMHDPDFIDIEYIQRLANFMGYKVLIDKSGVTDLNFGINASTEEDINRYLRFIVSNLPHWYKIKSTRDAVKILLYSFGLVGDIAYRWTSDNVTSANPTSGGYGNDFSLWKELDPNIAQHDAIEDIPDNYFPTPHFSIRIDAVNTPASWMSDLTKIINAIESIRPINDVFHGISVIFAERFDDVYVRMDTYDIIKDTFPFNTYYPVWTSATIEETGSASATYEETGVGPETIFES